MGGPVAIIQEGAGVDARTIDCNAIVDGERVVTTKTSHGRQRKVIRNISLITVETTSEGDTLSEFCGLVASEFNSDTHVIIDDVCYSIIDNTKVIQNGGLTIIELSRTGGVDSTNPHYYADFYRRP